MRMPSHSERNAGRYCLVDLVHLGAAVDTEVKPTWSRGTGVELRVDVLDVRATDDTDVDTQPDERLDLFPHRRRVRVAVGDCGAVPIEGDGLEAASQPAGQVSVFTNRSALVLHGRRPVRGVHVDVGIGQTPPPAPGADPADRSARAMGLLGFLGEDGVLAHLDLVDRGVQLQVVDASERALPCVEGIQAELEGAPPASTCPDPDRMRFLGHCSASSNVASTMRPEATARQGPWSRRSPCVVPWPATSGRWALALADRN